MSTMASTFSPNLNLELMADGEKGNAWGSITNQNLSAIDAEFGLTTNGDPSGLIGADYAGRMAYDTSLDAVWFSEATATTTASSVFHQIRSVGTLTNLDVTGTATIASLIVEGTLEAAIIQGASSASSIYVAGSATVSGTAVFKTNLVVEGTTTVSTLTVKGTSTFEATAVFKSAMIVQGTVTVSGTLAANKIVAGSVSISGGLSVTTFTPAALTVTGAATVGGDLVIKGDTSGSSATFDSVAGGAMSGSTLTLSGIATIGDDLIVKGSTSVNDLHATTMTVSGTATIASLVVSGTIQAGSGIITVGGTLELNPLAVTATSAAHGLGQQPDFVQVWLQNLTGEFGYSAGDRVSLTAGDMNDSGTSRLIGVDVDSTNVRFMIANTYPLVPRKDSTAAVAPTAANWKAVIIPFVFG